MKNNLPEIKNVAKWLFIFALSVFLVSEFFPESGTMDLGGSLNVGIFGLTLSALVASFAIFILGHLSPTIDEWIDSGGFLEDWEKISPNERIKWTLILLISIAGLVAFCLSVAY